MLKDPTGNSACGNLVDPTASSECPPGLGDQPADDAGKAMDRRNKIKRQSKYVAQEVERRMQKSKKSGSEAALAVAGVATVEAGTAVLAGTGVSLLIIYHLISDTKQRRKLADEIWEEINRRELADKDGNAKTADKVGDIADKTGLTPREVKDRIHDIKRRGGLEGNPDVDVDTDTGEVYPKTKDGGLGDSIGNIYDPIENDSSKKKSNRKRRDN